jgi:hypothetical protein
MQSLRLARLLITFVNLVNNLPTYRRNTRLKAKAEPRNILLAGQGLLIVENGFPLPAKADRRGTVA